MKNIKACTIEQAARNLKRFRGERTQDEIAEKIGVTRTAISLWESGKTEPGAVSVAKASLAMGFTPNDILLEGPDVSLVNRDIDGVTIPDDVCDQLLNILRYCVAFRQLNKPGRPDPVVYIETFLEQVAADCGFVLKTAENKPKEPLPIGTSIANPNEYVGAGLTVSKTFTSHKKSDNEKPGTDAASSAGEDPAKYGEPKARPQAERLLELASELAELAAASGHEAVHDTAGEIFVELDDLLRTPDAPPSTNAAEKAPDAGAAETEKPTTDSNGTQKKKSRKHPRKK